MARTKTPRAPSTPSIKATDARKSSISSRKKSATATTEPISAKELLELGSKRTQEHLLSKKTTGKYDGYIKRGRGLLQSIFEVRDKGKAGDPVAELLLDDDEEYLDEDEISLNDPEFRKAFDGRPSKYTPHAIAMILTWECFHQEKGVGTASGIHAAWIKEYDQLDGNNFRGDWYYDTARKDWYGNPARSAKVHDLMKSIQHKTSADDTQRHHSLAMSLPFMRMLYAWSMSVCPVTKVTELPKDLASLTLVTEHLRFRAFASSGFTVWTRNSELIHLQYKHLEFNCDRSRRKESPEERMFRLNLKFRKGWQAKSHQDSQLRGHCYGIYPHPEEPAIDMYEHMLNWLDLLELLLGRPLDAEDHLFPHVSINGTIDPTRNISANAVQTTLSEWARAAGLPSWAQFTTHCFRRGGAQYRFMYAPMGERWTLARIRWWGGWADGEKPNTLIRYLLDELHTYEEDHSDALRPIPRDADKSHAGEARLVAPLSCDEAYRLFEAQEAANRDAIHQTYLMASAGQYTTLAAAQPIASPSAVTSHGFTPQPPLNHAPPPMHMFARTNASPEATGVLTPTVFVETHLSRDRRGNLVPIPRFESMNDVETYKNTNPRQAPTDPSRFVPRITAKGAHAWKQVIRDWEEGDPSRSLMVPLKDWDPSWYSGDRTVGQRAGSHYGQRKIIATEFLEKFNGDEIAFTTAYPEHSRGVTKLLNAIRLARQQDDRQHDSLSARSRKRKSPGD